MDRLSLQILKYIAAQKEPISQSELVSKYKEAADRSLVYLEQEKLIKSGRTVIGCGPDMKPVFVSNGIFSITGKGLSFLEERPGKLFDRWLTRIIAIWGAATGTVAIMIEIWLHFL